MCECFETERQRTDEELTRREEELAFLATHDPLTGLPNRTLILDRVEQMLARSRRSQDAGGGAVRRPRQLQGHQRHARSRRRRRTPASGRRETRRRGARRRCAGAPRRGRVRRDLRGALAGSGPRADRRAPARCAQAPVQARSRQGDPCDRDGEHRDRDRETGSPPRSCCATRTSRCTGPSGTARIATPCSRPACRTPSRTAWNSRWTCAKLSRTTSSSSPTSPRST